ncbi:MAG: DedA family protein [bacterium]|jgi:membrane-associated protein
MIELVIQWKDFLNPEFYIQNGGLWLILFIIFAETGLFAGFFLPGDSLLFVAGIYSNELAAELFSLNNDFLNLLLICVLIIFSGILGNTVGYWFGAASGPYLFKKEDSLLFKKKHLYAAKEFYEKYGGGAIVFARFLPIIRTFAPIIAGIVRMDRHKFSFYNIVGCVAWVLSMMFGGHYLYKLFLNKFGFDLKDHLEVIIIFIVLITTAPVLIKIIRSGSKKKS